METVIYFQPPDDTTSSSSSWAALNSNVSLVSRGMSSLVAITLCIRVFFPYYRNSYSVVTLTNDQYKSYLSLNLHPHETNVILGDESFWAPVVAVPGFWNHLSLQVDFAASTWMIKINEKDYHSYFNISEEITSPNPVYVLFGRSLSLHSDEELSFYGKIADFKLFNSLLQKEEILQYFSCSLGDKMELANWDPGKVVLNGTVTTEQVSTENVCRPYNIYRVLLSPPLLLPVAESICQHFQGNLSVHGKTDVDYNDYNQPQLLALRSENVNDIILLNQEELKGIKYKHEKQKWSRLQNLMSKTTKTPSGTERKKWAARRPSKNIRNKYKMEALEEAKPRTKRIIRPAAEAEVEMIEDEEDVVEESTFSAYCDFPEPPVFRLNGFCPDLFEILDDTYIVVGKKDETETPIFQGFTGRDITYAGGMWVANSPYSTNFEMWFEDPINNPILSPMGRNLWLTMVTVNEELLENDVKLPCDSEYLYLNLSPCPSHLFTCTDGTCLPLSMRCDRKADCRDNSDEDYCYKIDVPMENRNDLPSRPLLGENITQVEMQLLIIAAKTDLDIMSISCDIWLTWKDPSLIFYNLQSDPMANMVDVESLNEIWVPTLECGENERRKIFVSNSSEVFVLRETFGHLENYEFSWEALSYPGSANSLQLKDRMKLSSKCTFNTFLFPFGMQKCSFPFVLTSSSPEVVMLTSSGPHGGISWLGSSDDFMYSISSIELKEKNGGIYSSQELIIKIYPRIGLAILTTYFPSLFIVIIAISSLYLNILLLEIRLLLAFLCLVSTLVLQIQTGTPLLGKTGINASDIWLFGAHIIIFGLNIANIKIAQTLNYGHPEERRPTTMRVVPVGVMTGKLTSPAVDSERASKLSNKLRIIFIILTASLVLIYIIVYAVLASLYTNN